MRTLMVSAVSSAESHRNINKGRKAPITWLIGVILAACHLWPDIPLVGQLTYPQLVDVYGSVRPWTSKGNRVWHVRPLLSGSPPLG